MNRTNILLLAAAALLAFAPLAVMSHAEFAGADDQAQAVINQIRPDYEPWFSAVWEPPSGEVESFLFALQAAAGAGFIGYFLGLRQGQRTRTSG